MQKTREIASFDLSVKQAFLKGLESEFRGEWSVDPLITGIYATDASHYQQWPLVVAWPKEEREVVTLVNLARNNGVPLVARGAGTSLGGQTIGPGLVLDLSRYMNRILEWNQDKKWVRVQPGVVRDILNKEAARFGLHFAPDPATSSRATIGGMIANNSSGTRSILYGKTIDHLLAIRVVTAQGEIITLQGGEHVINDDGSVFDADKYIQGLRNVLKGQENLIRDAFPKVMRRVGGYPLDYLTGIEPFNPSLLFCGSEGTLGVIVEAWVKLTPLPLAQSLCVLHFDSSREALENVEKVLAFRPSAVELLDKPVLELGRRNQETRKLMSMIQGQPGGLLLVEFSEDSKEEARAKADSLSHAFQKGPYEHPVRVLGVDPDYHEPWELRKKGLGILMGAPTTRKPVAFIEDSCVPVQVLPSYIDDVLEICENEGLKAIIYAHASVGVIHVRPLLDLGDQEDVDRMQRISEKVFERVVHYKGAWSGEHGDGYVRSYKNKEFFGHDVYELMRSVKALFDPVGIMNPGKVVDAPAMTDNLRFGPSLKSLEKEPSTDFRFGETGGFNAGVHLCSGVGECLKREKGVMCPSYRATLEEEHSTRGRANALRLAMSGQLEGGLTDDRVHQALELCLSCKACKTECPSNVDMARLKSQVNHWRHKDKGVPFRTRILAFSPQMARWLSGKAAYVINPMINFAPLRKLLGYVSGISPERPLPRFSTNPFTRTEMQIENPFTKGRVVLFADTYTAYHEDQISRLAVRLLVRLGYEVDLFSAGCCQRPAISMGLLDQARKKGGDTVSALKKFAGKAPVLVLEPGCASAFLDDLPDLLPKEEGDFLSGQVKLFEEFLGERLEDMDAQNISIRLKEGSYAIHGHCHHKAMFGMEKMKAWFTRYMEGDLLWLESGCCGMAGAFGYHVEHQAISRKIAEQSILGQMRSFPSRTILATGFSCRHQIRDLSECKVKHWLEVIEW